AAILLNCRLSRISRFDKEAAKLSPSRLLKFLLLRREMALTFPSGASMPFRSSSTELEHTRLPTEVMEALNPDKERRALLLSRRSSLICFNLGIPDRDTNFSLEVTDKLPTFSRLSRPEKSVSTALPTTDNSMSSVNPSSPSRLVKAGFEVMENVT